MKTAIASLVGLIAILWWTFYDLPDQIKEIADQQNKQSELLNSLEQRVGEFKTDLDQISYQLDKQSYRLNLLEVRLNEVESDDIQQDDLGGI